MYQTLANQEEMIENKKKYGLSAGIAYLQVEMMDTDQQLHLNEHVNYYKLGCCSEGRGNQSQRAHNRGTRPGPGVREGFYEEGIFQLVWLECCQLFVIVCVFSTSDKFLLMFSFQICAQRVPSCNFPELFLSLIFTFLLVSRIIHYLYPPPPPSLSPSFCRSGV